MLIVNKKKYLIILSILIGIIFLVNDNFFNNDPNQIVFNNDIKKPLLFIFIINLSLRSVSDIRLINEIYTITKNAGK